MRKLTAVDLFSGCGGLTLGLKRAGFRVLGAIDVDPLAVETYRVNHPGTVVWEKDITHVSVEELKRRLGLRPRRLDLLAGCPPCQGFSTMRTLNGGRRIREARNELIFEFSRFVRGLRPQAVLMENVPGLAEDHRMKTFCAELRRLGYAVHYRVLNAVDYGVPQRRRRVILLASRGGLIDFPTPRVERRTVRQAIGGLPRVGDSGDGLHDLQENRSSRIRALIAKIPHDGGGREDLPRREQLACHQQVDGFKDVYGRMAWDEPAPTITGGCVNPSKGRFLHPIEDRTVTLREAALLQSFPPDYHFSLRRGKFPAAELIGNALPPDFVKAQALEISRFLKRRAEA